MTTVRSNGRDWTLHSAYRREGRLWKGVVYWNPDWVAMHLDGIPTRRVWAGTSFSEKKIRRRIAAQLLKERRDKDEDGWVYHGRRAA